MWLHIASCSTHSIVLHTLYCVWTFLGKKRGAGMLMWHGGFQEFTAYTQYFVNSRIQPCFRLFFDEKGKRWTFAKLGVIEAFFQMALCFRNAWVGCAFNWTIVLQNIVAHSIGQSCFRISTSVGVWNGGIFGPNCLGHKKWRGET